MRFTEKQCQIMMTLLKGNDDGTFLDIDQLLDALPYETTKQSLQFSIRALVKHGMVNKIERQVRRSRNRTVLAPTGLAYSSFGGVKPVAGVDEGKTDSP